MTIHLVPRVLIYVEQVAQTGSIQAASRELGISASAIHRQIISMEDALGESLFDRESKGMVLTHTGQLILDLARDWRLDTARLWSTVQANRGVEQGHLKIAAMDSMVNGFVPELVSRIGQNFPLVQVEIEITSPDGAAKGVLEGEYDLAAVANVSKRDNVEFHWSREYPLGCIASPEHSVAKQSDMRFRDLVGHAVVFQSKALSIRKLLEAKHSWIFEQAARSITVNSIQLMKRLVLSGEYVAVTSELDAGPEIRTGQLKFIPITDRDVFSQTISLISNAELPNARVSRKIVDLAVDLLEGSRA